MAVENFDGSLSLVLKAEGGYVDHPADPGGATNLGITIGTLSEELGRPATKAEVRALTPAKVAPIYRRRYWDKCRCDDLPSGPDHATFDAGVNSGPGQGVRWLQGALGVTVDGRIGSGTLQAARNAPDKAAVTRKACELRRSFLRGLRIFATFGKGWVKRVAEVEAHAVALALVAAGHPPAVVAEKLEEYGSQNAAKAKAETGKATGAGAGAAGAGTVSAQPDLSGLDTTSLIVLALVAVVLGVMALILWRNARAERQVAAAYAAKAQEIASSLSTEHS